jgi:hypothetical protein
LKEKASHMLPQKVSALYKEILSHGEAGMQRFYDALRKRGIEPVPDPARNLVDLYASNPVILHGTIVQTMTEDVNRFCEILRETIPDADSLMARAPEVVQENYASQDVAEKIITALRHAHPLAMLDGFLVETERGLSPEYLEWQTAGSYLTLGRWVLECAAATWPEILRYSSLTAWPGLTLEKFSAELRAYYLQGIEDDPRQGVILDYSPHQQVTRREFYAIQELTGGPEHGMGILDPREVTIANHRPHYQRDGKLIPIARAYSRMVYSEMVQVLSEATAAERVSIRQFFGDANVSWICHPLHFFYGAKADLCDFWLGGLSSSIPECKLITSEFIAMQTKSYGADHQLHGFVMKPKDLQSGLHVTLNPLISQLQTGWILQKEIHAAACHPTLFGMRTPEIRVMCLPDHSGKLITGLVFTRVKSPEVFLSGAGHTANLNIPGTGEGYAIVVYDT